MSEKHSLQSPKDVQQLVGPTLIRFELTTIEWTEVELQIGASYRMHSGCHPFDGVVGQHIALWLWPGSDPMCADIGTPSDEFCGVAAKPPPDP